MRRVRLDPAARVQRADEACTRFSRVAYVIGAMALAFGWAFILASHVRPV